MVQRSHFILAEPPRLPYAAFHPVAGDSSLEYFLGNGDHYPVQSASSATETAETKNASLHFEEAAFGKETGYVIPAAQPLLLRESMADRFHLLVVFQVNLDGFCN